MITIPPYLANLPSCVLYLRGSSGSNILDWSPKRRTVTNVSVSQGTSPIKFPPKSLYFNGSAKLTMASSADFSGTKTFAICGKIYRVGTGIQIIFGADTAANTAGQWFVAWNSTDGLYFQFRESGGSAWFGGGTLPQSTWSNFAVIGDGTNVNIYIDTTTPVYTHAISTNLSDASGLSVGDRPSGTSYPFSGNIDEILFFNGSLGKIPTAAQIFSVLNTRRFIV